MGKSSGAQPDRHFGRAITDGAISDDRIIFRNIRQRRFGRAAQINPVRIRKMIHIPFIDRPDIEKQRRRMMPTFHPTGQLARRDPSDLRNWVCSEALSRNR